MIKGWTLQEREGGSQVVRNVFGKSFMEVGYLGNWLLLLLISRHPINHLENTSNYDVAFRFPMLKTIKKEADQTRPELSTVQSGASSPEEEEEEAWSGQGSGVSSPEVQHKQQQKIHHAKLV